MKQTDDLADLLRDFEVASAALALIGERLRALPRAHVELEGPREITAQEFRLR